MSIWEAPTRPCSVLMIVLCRPLTAPLETALLSPMLPPPLPIAQASKPTLAHVRLVSLLGGMK